MQWNDLEEAAKLLSWIEQHEKRKAVARSMRLVDFYTETDDGKGGMTTIYAYDPVGLTRQQAHDFFIEAVVRDADTQIEKHRAAIIRMGALPPSSGAVAMLPAPVRRPVKAAKRRAA